MCVFPVLLSAPLSHWTYSKNVRISFIVKNFKTAGQGSVTWEAEAGGTKIQGYPCLRSEFKVALGTLDPTCLKKKKEFQGGDGGSLNEVLCVAVWLGALRRKFFSC